MMKSQVKLCDITKRRMPLSFMVRFVNAAEGDLHHTHKAVNAPKQFFVPDFTSTDKMHQYIYCLAHPDVIKRCEGNPKKYSNKGLKERMIIEFVSIEN